MARKKKPEEHANHERWLVSYADFITLLFAFFTTMYAIGESDRGKASKFIHSINTAFHRYDSILPTEMAMVAGGQMASPLVRSERGGSLDSIVVFKGEDRAPVPEQTSDTEQPAAEDGETEPRPASGPVEGAGKEPGEEGGGGADSSAGDAAEGVAGGQPTPTPTATPTPTPTPAPTLKPAEGSAEDAGPAEDAGLPGGGGMSGADFEHVIDELQRYLDEENLRDSVTLKRDERGVVISLSEAGFFEPGRADLKAESTAYLDRIARTIQRLHHKIQIDGHTDNTPIRYSPYQSNLELSVARAAKTHQFLVEKQGFDPALMGAAGWGEWRPVASNDTAEGRGRNRRVDIVILGSGAAAPAVP